MKLLFISEYFVPKIMGGGEINLFLMAKALTKKNIEVTVLTSYHKGLKRYEEIEGIKIYRRLKTGENASGIISNFKRSYIFPKSIAKETKILKRKKDFDVIHFIGTSIIAGKELRVLKKPMIATIESYPTLCPKGDRIYCGKEECKIVCGFWKFLKCQKKSHEIGKMKNRFYLKYNPLFLIYLYKYFKKLNDSLKYSKLIAISEYIQEVLKKYSQESKVLPNAINLEKFYSKDTGNGKTKIVYLGSLTKYKGPHILLKALKEIDCRCDLYGEGIMKDELNKIIIDYGLDAEIHNNVPYEKVPEIYANSDIVVFPSIWPEPFGRIAIEAMAAGKPVIGSDIGGIKGTIEKGTGILVKRGSVIELRQMIIMLIKNPLLMKSLGKKGKLIVKKYEENNVINKLIKIYSGVMK